jgi:hypothetical protein
MKDIRSCTNTFENSEDSLDADILTSDDGMKMKSKHKNSCCSSGLFRGSGI